MLELYEFADGLLAECDNTVTLPTVGIFRPEKGDVYCHNGSYTVII
jgi:hypothetical protein